MTCRTLWVTQAPELWARCARLGRLRSQSKFTEHVIALGLRHDKPLQHHEELDTRACGVFARTLYVAEVDQKLLRAQFKKAYFVFELAHGH